ncbi:MAG TPA: aliphatic sulfonate ABC transporter substrate-binding protein [Chroococcidiopsis sp.]
MVSFIRRLHRYVTRPFSRLIDRRSFNVLLGLCSLFLVVTFAGCSPASDTASSPSPDASASPTASAAPSEIRIGYQVVPNAELLVKALGLAEKAFPNTKIEWKSFDSGRDVNTAIAANGLDLGLVGSTGTSVGISNGLPYQVYFLHDVIGDNEALAVKTSANIKTLADLKGRKIGVPFGSTTHFSLLSALEKAGIATTDLQVLDLQPPDILAAWQRGDIDGAFVWQPTLKKLVDDGGTILVTAKTLSEQGIITADVGVAHKDFISQYPDALKQYVGVLDEAVKFYREQPEEAGKALAAELGLTPEESLAVANELVWLDSSEQSGADYLGKPGSPGAFAEVLKASADFMKAQGTISATPDLAVFKDAIYSAAIAQ